MSKDAFAYLVRNLLSQHNYLDDGNGNLSQPKLETLPSLYASSKPYSKLLTVVSLYLVIFLNNVLKLSSPPLEEGQPFSVLLAFLMKIFQVSMVTSHLSQQLTCFLSLFWRTPSITWEITDMYNKSSLNIVDRFCNFNRNHT